MYGDLAPWWPLVSAPGDYAEEAAFYLQALTVACDHPPATLLELGSGGGNNASHMKAGLRLTLVDRSPGMLAVSRALNPGCEHVLGDMRTVRLGRTFDLVFVHDAISYMTTRADLRAALQTAWVHTAPGGAALFAPDHVRETFRTGTTLHGSDDESGRALRYLEWSWDPDPDDTSYTVDYVFALRTADGEVRVEHDRHVEGLFARQEWLDTLAEVGFEARRLEFHHTEVEGALEVFVGRRAG